jgi:radical SAM protein with 4Fe4S-binding SPASM domain
VDGASCQGGDRRQWGGEVQEVVPQACRDLPVMATATPSERRPAFTLQWHLTRACSNACRHCYMTPQATRVPLSLGECKRVIDDFKLLLARWDCEGRIHFTGGDPLLFADFFPLLEYARATIPSAVMGILGNPELLTEEVAERLRDDGIFTYQLSIDGLKATHDYFRYPGSFDATLSAIGLLRKKGIRTAVMSTVSKPNMAELPDLVDVLAAQAGVDLFGFHRFVPAGAGRQVADASSFSAGEYRHFLRRLCDTYREHAGAQTVFSASGEPLWALCAWEEGGLQDPPAMEGDNGGGTLLWSGCSIGCSEMCILEDGTVLACRRLPIPIGKVPEESLRDIFILSKMLNEMRDVKRLEKCRSCELLPHCRGCRAMAYAAGGDVFSVDPHCWK